MVTILATYVAAEGNEEKLAEGLRDYVPIQMVGSTGPGPLNSYIPPPHFTGVAQGP